ncbi:uncharacterized protein An15g01580 [Aspergillus niger]|uniref:Choline monooxygenase, chloroplastic n=2 Tax=Aspergillus niger TaxID=5061 RepID=A2R4U0_ASPNC|nr:uncharacterized protein An15g01580 [Aspergillus niger]CAL00972.1 unnamed protein product [Aspergillus niger]
MSIKSLVAENNLGATPKAPRHANRPRFRYSLGRGAQLPGVFPGLGATTPEGELHQAPLQTQHQIRGAIQLEDYECLHCQYTHPSFSVYYPPTSYAVHNHQNFSQHIADPEKPDDGLFLYFFPNCTLNVYGGGMSSFRVCPTEDSNVTRMEFDYYHMESGEKFDEYFKFVRQVAMEDYELCEKAQNNLTKGIYSEGILNPEKESGVSYYQGRVFELVCQQHTAERRERELEDAKDDSQKRGLQRITTAA